MATPNKKSSAVDWELVERDFRAGIKSLRVIGKECLVTEGAIRKRAKRDGWTRDLAAKIRLKAESLVRMEAVRSSVRTEAKATESEIIDANAEIHANVVRDERKVVTRARKLAMSLLGELEHQTENRDLYATLGELLFSPDKNGIDKLNEIYRKAMATPSRINSMKQLADTLKTLIDLERRIHGIEEKTAEVPYEEMLRQFHGLVTA